VGAVEHHGPDQQAIRRAPLADDPKTDPIEDKATEPNTDKEPELREPELKEPKGGKEPEDG
jgi:hypothetical protein